MSGNKLIRLIYSDLDSELKYNEAILEQLLNNDISLTSSSDSIKIIKEITSIKNSIITLNNYIGL